MDTRKNQFTNRPHWLAFGAVLSLASPLSAITTQSIPVVPDGQFTYDNGIIHYWSGSSGYNTYNVDTGVTTTIGEPPGGTTSNGFGDPFGVYDASSGIFYAATLYNWSDSMVYRYDTGASSWLTHSLGAPNDIPYGVYMTNAYGAQSHNGTLYVSGLAEPWNGGYGQANFIFAFDEDGRHDTLLETAGNSASLAVAPNGDIYYGTFSDNTLYRWTAAQVASVTDDLYGVDPVDNFLTLDDAEVILAMPGSGNGVAVDDAGNVFFAVNNGAGASHILGMVDENEPDGYQIIYSQDSGGWFGSISATGDFTAGDPLYFSPTFGGDLIQIQVPEPAHYALLGGLSAIGLLALRRRLRR